MLYLKEPVSLSSILESSAADAGSSTSPTLTKIIGTLGPQSRSVEILEKLLQAGMCVARFDFSWGDDAYHQETLENLRTAVKNTKRLCAVMLDTVGPELQVLNNNNNNNQAIAIDLQQGETIILTPDKSKPASSNFSSDQLRTPCFRRQTWRRDLRRTVLVYRKRGNIGVAGGDAHTR
jgi:pyruvate kinase